MTCRDAEDLQIMFVLHGYEPTQSRNCSSTVVGLNLEGHAVDSDAIWGRSKDFQLLVLAGEPQKGNWYDSDMEVGSKVFQYMGLREEFPHFLGYVFLAR